MAKNIVWNRRRRAVTGWEGRTERVKLALLRNRASTPLVKTMNSTHTSYDTKKAETGWRSAPSAGATHVGDEGPGAKAIFTNN